jgi:hypothetical protein
MSDVLIFGFDLVAIFVLAQEEVAYYFASLALGLLAGMQPDPLWLTPVLGTLLVAVMFVADHVRVHARYRQQVVVLDTACTDEDELTRRLGTLLGAEVCRLVVNKVDLVRDTTTVDVRYRLPAPQAGARPGPAMVAPAAASATTGNGTRP